MNIYEKIFARLEELHIARLNYHEELVLLPARLVWRKKRLIHRLTN